MAHTESTLCIARMGEFQIPFVMYLWVDSDVLQLEQLVQEEGRGESTSGRIPGDLHCHSCHVTFTGREEQVT